MFDVALYPNSPTGFDVFYFTCFPLVSPPVWISSSLYSIHCCPILPSSEPVSTHGLNPSLHVYIFYYFLIKPPESRRCSGSSPNGGDQTHWGFYTPAFHLRIDLLKDTQAKRRICICVCQSAAGYCKVIRASQSEYSRPLNLKCSLRLAWVFSPRGGALWGWGLTIWSPPAWR